MLFGRFQGALKAATAVLAISLFGGLLPSHAAALTTTVEGAALLPAGFTISPPWAPGVGHTITQAYNSGLHKNVDLGCCNNDYYAVDFDLHLGEPVFAVAPGRVLFAGAAAGSWGTFGNIVLLDHGNGIQSLYAHLDSIAVVTGQSVTAETQIGAAGGSGGMPVHLHFAMYQGVNFLHSVGGTGPYGGRAVLPEPFSQCREADGRACENLVTGMRLIRAGSAPQPAPAASVQPGALVPAAAMTLAATNLTQSGNGPVTLRWDPPAGAQQYELQVVPFNEDGPGIDLVIGDEAMVRSGSFSIAMPVMGQGNYVLLPGALYSWRIRYASAAGWGPWSSRQQFQTEPPSAGTITVYPPAPSANLLPTIRWTDSNASNFYYEIQVSRDPDFGAAGPVAPVYWNLVHGGISNPLDSWTVPPDYPLTPGRYYVRLRQRLQATPAGAAEPGIPWTPAVSFIVLPS